jgi:hypothetical protein
MICDACNVIASWKGEHRCHSEDGSGIIGVRGNNVRGVCECYYSGKCKPPTKAELEAFRKSLQNKTD